MPVSKSMYGKPTELCTSERFAGGFFKVSFLGLKTGARRAGVDDTDSSSVSPVSDPFAISIFSSNGGARFPSRRLG
jgi:hypothetical protein